jgi:hypothetical protein
MVGMLQIMQEIQAAQAQQQQAQAQA